MAQLSAELANEIARVSAELGISALDLATVIGYETGGTYDPWQRGPTTRWGEHRGLIQWGEPQARQYGVTANTSIRDQLTAVGRYLRDTGVRAGHGILDIYSAINAGHVGRPNASDRPGRTVSTHVRDMNQGIRDQGNAVPCFGLPHRPDQLLLHNGQVVWLSLSLGRPVIRCLSLFVARLISSTIGYDRFVENGTRASHDLE